MFERDPCLPVDLLIGAEDAYQPESEQGSSDKKTYDLPVGKGHFFYLCNHPKAQTRFKMHGTQPCIKLRMCLDQRELSTLSPQPMVMDQQRECTTH